MALNILVTAAGSPGFITVCKAILSYEPKSNIHGCDINPDSVGLKFASKSFIVPPGNDDNYVNCVFDYCNDNDINVIIPGADEELIALSREKERFKKIRCKILISKSQVLEKVLDKSSLYRECYNIPGLKEVVPEHFSCTYSKEFSEAYKKLSAAGHQVCVKPAVTHGSRGFRVIKPEITKKDFFEKKPSSRSITLQSILDILKSGDGKFPNLLVMEYLPGEEFSVDCIRRGENFYCVTRRRDVIKDGICSAGEAIKREDLIYFSKKIYQELGLEYNANLQFRYDSKGNPKLLEVNPRLSGTLELCRGAGVNFVSLGLDALLGTSKSGPVEIKWGTKMQRVWEEVFFIEDSIFTLENISGVIKQF